MADRQNYGVIELLYGNLNITDVKTQSLLAFNSLIVASLVFLYVDSHIFWLKLLLILTFLLIMFSSFRSLMILNINVASTKDLLQPNILEEKLLELRDKRTFDYRLSRFCSMAALAGFILSLIANFILQ